MRSSTATLIVILTVVALLAGAVSFGISIERQDQERERMAQQVSDANKRANVAVRKMRLMQRHLQQMEAIRNRPPLA